MNRIFNLFSKSDMMGTKSNIYIGVAFLLLWASSYSGVFSLMAIPFLIAGSIFNSHERKILKQIRKEIDNHGKPNHRRNRQVPSANQ